MKLKSPLIVLLVFVLAVLFFGWVHDRRINEGFATIRADATEDSVRGLLGKPSSINSSCAAYDTQLTVNCDHVLVYRSAFGPLKPSYWLVFVDAKGLTKATSRQSKP
ncbi:hypothetical protein [Granulicella arctica]|uniref:hypothetical protein n=1 Tax=Granulicella arctica TaxID=940613 RepID=UPI0021DF8673|nr:hypothetical protein [Granulicella arctica]